MGTAEVMQYALDFQMLKKLHHLKSREADLCTARDSESGRTYLQEAASRGFLYSTQFLIKNGVDVNYAPYDDSPLMLATKSGQVKIVELLLKNKADMNAVFYDSFLGIPKTPLSYAKANHMVDVVEVFMKYGGFCLPVELEEIKRKAKEEQIIRSTLSDKGLER